MDLPAAPQPESPAYWEVVTTETLAQSVRVGRQEGLHLLSSTTDPTDKWGAYVVDFRSIFSLPVGYLTTHAKSLGKRHRLRSPFLEHFSQAFARFFMRVGLPTNIPSYSENPKRPPQREPADVQ